VAQDNVSVEEQKMKSTIKLITNPRTELQHQTNVMRWSMTVRDRFPELRLLHHVPNGGSRDKVEAKHLKEAGVKAGVPDLDLPVPRGPYHGLRIEMKAPDGRESPEQTWWREQLTEQGYCAEVCYGWKNAVELIEQYLLQGAYHS
jgi:hypothetical protein